MFQYYLIIYSFCIMILLFISGSLIARPRKKQQVKLFVHVCSMAIIIFLIDLMWTGMYTSGFAAKHITLSYGVNAVYYILFGLFGFSWVMYSEYVQRSKLYTNLRLRALCLIPAGILSIFAVTAGWNHGLFYLEADGTFVRGSFYFIQLVCTLCPCLFSSLKALSLSFYTIDRMTKNEYQSIASFTAIPFLTTFLQLAYADLPTQCLGFAFGGLMIYLNLREAEQYTDGSTGLNNRTYMELYLSSRMKETEINKLFLALFTINGYSTIPEDKQTEAAVTLSDSIHRVCQGTDAYLCRFSADQFVILYNTSDRFVLEGICEEVLTDLAERSKVSGLTLNVDYGIAPYEARIQSAQAFVTAANTDKYLKSR